MGIRERNEGPELERCPVCRTGVVETVGFSWCDLGLKIADVLSVGDVD